MVDAVGKSSFTYQNFGPFWSALASEDGPWLSDKLSRTYYANGLPYAYAVEDGWSGSYGYDNLLRLHTLTSPAGTFTYNYANTTGRQISSLALPGGSSITYGYDPAGLLTSTALKNSVNTVLDSYGYTYDAVGWRTNVLRADGTQVAYGYDNIGQLTTATGFESGGAHRLNENFGYTYDPAGNLTQRVNDTLSQTFTPDPANELTNVLRTTSVMTVAGGLTNSPTSLTINGKSANIYGDKTFAATNVALVDGLNTFTNILTISGSSFTNQLTKNIPASANLSYDLNGNMTSDGLHGLEYDCANQLTRITQTNKFKSEFVYDGFGRRRIRREYAWTGTWAPTSETHYVYDGMLVIEERDGNNATQVSYTRGLDLSGNEQGAGGIGGLLARTDANGSAFYYADGNGNVTAMINSSGTVLAKYLYDSYGNILNKSGSLADVNLYRFSSKEVHVPSGLYYYGFRYYEPNLQRWLDRDPIDEKGGINLYRFAGNSSLNAVDTFGEWIEYFNPRGWFYNPNTFVSHPALPVPPPYSYGRMYGIDNDFNGKTGGELVADIGKAVVKGPIDTAMMLGGPGEGETLYDALTDAEKISKNVSQCANALRQHHSWPKYLGGAEKQDLVPLEKWLHDAYHSGLDKILPRQNGTEYYENLSPAQQQQALQDLATYTKAFDAKYGTHLYEAMKKEGFPVP